jgi:hypothetical protein
MASVASFPAFELSEVDGCEEGRVLWTVGAVMKGTSTDCTRFFCAGGAFGGASLSVYVLGWYPCAAVWPGTVNSVASRDRPFCFSLSVFCFH